MKNSTLPGIRIKLVTLISIIAIIAVIISFFHNRPSNSRKIIYAVLPLTGNIAEAGSHYKKTMDMYLNSHPNAEMTVEYVDSGFDTVKANTALLQKTVGVASPIVITAITAISEALFPTIKNLGGFQIGISTLESPTYREANTLQRISTTSLDGIIPLVSHAVKNNRTISIIYSQNDYGISVKNMVKQECELHHVQIVAEVDYSLGNPDVRQPVLNAVSSKSVDAVFVCGASTPAYINVFKELEALGYTGKIYADGVFTVPTVMKAVSANVQKKTVFPCFDCFLSAPNTSKGKAFRAACLSNGLSPYFVVVETYVSMAAVDELLHRGQPIDTDSFMTLNQFDTVVDVDFRSIGNAKFQYILGTVNEKEEVIPLP